MLRLTWRVAAGAALMGSGALAAACSSGNTAENSGFGSGGSSSGGTFGDGGSVFDASVDGPTGFGNDGGGMPGDATTIPVTPVTSALFVNAMPASWRTGDSALRFCWSSDGASFHGQPVGDGGAEADDGGTDEPFPSAIMPASNFAGVPLGGTVLLSDATTLLAPPDGGSVSLYAIRAYQLQSYSAADTPCDTLFSPTSKKLQPGADYFDLGPVSIRGGATNVIVVDGCIGAGLSPTASKTSCGPSWDITATAGNLSVQSFTLASFDVADGGLAAVQAALLSPGFAELIPEGGTATISLAALSEGGAGTDIVQTIGKVSGEGQVFPSAPVLLPVGGGLASYADLGLRLDVAGADAGTLSLFLTLAQIQELADPTADPRIFYGNPGTYLVGIVGDPGGVPPFTTTAEGGTYDGTGLHFVFAQAHP
jgi:hypothetical protein